MRVTMPQIVHGITEYIQSDILPQMGGARSMQILVSVGANAIASNGKLADAVLKNPIILAMLDDDGSGTYDLGGLVDAVTKSIRQYGSFPITVPAIPLISPAGFTLSLTADDIDAMKRKIEESV